jgi:hypothetical protein
MAADPSSLMLSELWRKATHSGANGCVEAALVEAPHLWPVDTATVTEADIAV